MPTKTRTKKPAAKPQRKPRKSVKLTDHITPEAIGRSIAASLHDSLGRTLTDLLAKPDNPGFDAVAGRTVEKLGDGDGVTGFTRAKYATELAQAPEEGASPVQKAIAHLIDAILGAERATQDETERLASVLSPPFPESNAEKMPTPGAGVLSSAIHSLAERVYADNRRRNELLDRLEL